MTFSDVLIGAALEADKSIDKDDLYTKLLSGFARSASAFDSVPPPYKAWTKTEYFICPSDDGTSRHCRRMTFSNLLDLIYFDLCGAIQRNALPKVCKLCQRIFWEEPGTSYEYCYYIAPCDRFAGETAETCREISAKDGYRSKLKNNPIWSYFHRAYNKYHARKTKRTMTNTEFATWLMNAQEIRDEALQKGVGNVDLD